MNGGPISFRNKVLESGCCAKLISKKSVLSILHEKVVLRHAQVEDALLILRVRFDAQDGPFWRMLAWPSYSNGLRYT